MRIRAVPLALLVAMPCVPAAAQAPERVRVVAGPEYRAGWLHAELYGRSYRGVWTTPLEVPVLDLRAHAGGLTPTRGGGDRQTRNLRLRGGDGREYVFRSVHKDFPFLTPELRRSYAGRVVLDQLKSEFPAGALVLPGLLEAVGVLHPVPRLFVMPDDPALGEHRPVFAGMLGTLEERPEEGADGRPGFTGARRVVGTDRLLGIHGWLLRHNHPVRLTQAELEAHAEWRGFGTEAGAHPPMRGWLAAPIIDRAGKNWGLLQLSDRYEGEFTAEDEANLVRLTALVSDALGALWELRNVRKALTLERAPPTACPPGPGAEA
jgi:hypothetical protein